jgi:hypothetical protein
LVYAYGFWLDYKPPKVGNQMITSLFATMPCIILGRKYLILNRNLFTAEFFDDQ